MTFEILEKHFVAYGLDAGLVHALLSHYREMKRAFFVENWEQVGVRGGKFVEAVFGLLELIVTGNRTGAKPNHLLKVLESSSSSAHRSFKMTIPRVAYGVYEIRSNRDMAHLSLEIDSNRMDGIFVVSACDWVLAELTRLCLATHPSEAEQMIQRIVERPVPLVEEIDGDIVVHDPSLPWEDQVILALSKKDPERVDNAQLRDWLKPDRDLLISKALEQLEQRREVHRNADGSTLTSTGRRRAEGLLKSRWQARWKERP
jgi:hypothetical protein